MTAPTSLLAKGLTLLGKASNHLSVLAGHPGERAHQVGESEDMLTESLVAFRQEHERIVNRLDGIGNAVKAGVIRGTLLNRLDRLPNRNAARLLFEAGICDECLIKLHESLQSFEGRNSEGTSAPGSASADPGQSGGAA